MRIVEEEADLLGHGLSLVPSPVGRDDEDVGAADPQEALDTGPEGDADCGAFESFDEALGVLGGGGEIDEVGGFLGGEFADGQGGEQFEESGWHVDPFNGRRVSSTTRSCGRSMFEAPYLVDTIAHCFKLRQDVTSLLVLRWHALDLRQPAHSLDGCRKGRPDSDESRHPFAQEGPKGFSRLPNAGDACADSSKARSRRWNPPAGRRREHRPPSPTRSAGNPLSPRG